MYMYNIRVLSFLIMTKMHDKNTSGELGVQSCSFQEC